MLQSLPVDMVHQDHLQWCPDASVNTLEVTLQQARLPALRLPWGSSSQPAKAVSAPPQHKWPSQLGMEGSLLHHVEAHSTMQRLCNASRPCHQEAA